MTYQIPLHKSLSCQSAFDYLLEGLSHDCRNFFQILSPERFKKHYENVEEWTARHILRQLLSKMSEQEGKKNWKSNEIELLIFVVDKYCLVSKRSIDQLMDEDWKNISLAIPLRNSESCKFRLLSLLSIKISNFPWSAQESLLLERIVQTQAQKSATFNWKQISQKLYQVNHAQNYRTGKQCREHYSCFLRPNLKKGAWTDHEDYQLINLYLQEGKKWSKIAKLIEGRNQNSIKNRFFLMFVHKSEKSLSSSELLKKILKRKEKIQKKLTLLGNESFLNSQSMEIHLNQNISYSNMQMKTGENKNEEIQNEDESKNEIEMKENILVNAHAFEEGLQKYELPSSQDDENFFNEQFQRYINF